MAADAGHCDGFGAGGMRHCDGTGYCPLKFCHRCEHAGTAGPCAGCAGTGSRP